MKNYSILFFVLTSAISCKEVNKSNNLFDEGFIKNNTYENKELGWQIEIPQGWKITTRAKRDASEKKGKNAMEKTLKKEMNTKNVKKLIAFQKNKANSFTSSSVLFNEESQGQYEKYIKNSINEIYTVLISYGAYNDTATGKEEIQGLEFKTAYFTFYSSKGKKLFNQIYYNKLINGNDLSITITYNNVLDKEIMLNALRNSKFKITKN